MLNKDKILDQIKGKIHCSQIVFSTACGEMALGYGEDEALRLASPFGGGMFCGDTCGAVIGALLAIGAKYGNCEHGNAEQDKICVKKVKQFQQKFIASHGSTICRELLGYDFSNPEERREAFETGKVFKLCPVFILDAVMILREIDD